MGRTNVSVEDMRKNVGSAIRKVKDRVKGVKAKEPEPVTMAPRIVAPSPAPPPKKKGWFG